MTPLAAARQRLAALQPVAIHGTVASLRGLTLFVDDLPAPVGGLVRVGLARDRRLGEVVGFDGARAIVMLLGESTGVRVGDGVTLTDASASVPVCHAMLGRVIDALGRPIDHKPVLRDATHKPLQPTPLTAMQRGRITQTLETGVRAIDAMNTVGKGQRVGIFAGPGVGKSTLLGMIARRTRADVNVIALIGERGREVRDFLEHALGKEGLARSVVIVSTSDESPLLRTRAALVACTVAEHFRAHGADVMLMLDSVTRLAHAQRQIGLAVGEPPATRGYTPSVFAMLPRVLERAGVVVDEHNRPSGSITGFYTTLVEGDDMTEPVADAVRGILDGHVVLTRKLAQSGHYPAIDVLDSVSRVADDISTPQHAEDRRTVRRLIAAKRDVEELIQIGAYARGSDPKVDTALALDQHINALLTQSTDDATPITDTVQALNTIATQANAMTNR